MEATKTTEKAVALKYDERHPAPRVVASGQGEVARRIIAAAREAGIAVNEDPALVELLGKIPIGDEIPVELYQAVAEILAFVYRLEQRRSAT